VRLANGGQLTARMVVNACGALYRPLGPPALEALVPGQDVHPCAGQRHCFDEVRGQQGLSL
jgi:thioredoxin reductase